MDIKKTSNKPSTSSNSTLHHTKHINPTTTLNLSNTSTPKYKGVVEQQNGTWGAQIYTNHKRIWLGTFKSTVEAAMAYDSASIKLRNFDAKIKRNFPFSDFIIHEPNFQELYTTEVVLKMIKDRSYQHKFKDFLRIHRTKQESNKCFTSTQLFQKELTPSDVGRLNRLVIPKKYAVKYLPFTNEDEQRSKDMEIMVYDKEMRQWKFRYCYWKSSQSFVLTRGWNSFVKEKNLKEKDVIIFYTCHVASEVKTLEGESKKFLMIDVEYFSDNGFVGPVEVVKEMVGESYDGEMKTEETKGGFMLFGVRIK